MSMRNTIQTFVWDRSDPDEVVTIGIASDGSGEVERITRSQDLKEGLFCRSDMAMVNFWDANGELAKQVCVYFTRRGIKWNDVQRYFTDEEQDQIKRCYQKILAVEKDHPEFAYYLGY